MTMVLDRTPPEVALQRPFAPDVDGTTNASHRVPAEDRPEHRGDVSGDGSVAPGICDEGRDALWVHDGASIAIVGNAPVRCDQGEAIDRHDVVVRCNNAVGFGAERGCRVDQLVLINCGGQMEEWLRTGSIETGAAFLATPRVCLPIHPRKASLIVPPLDRREREAAREQDFTEAATLRFVRLGKAVDLYDAAHFARSVRALGYAALKRDAPAPSTGYLAARWWVEQARSRGWRCHAYGFGFEGWHGHDFEAERAWFDRAASTGFLSVHALDDPMELGMAEALVGHG